MHRYCSEQICSENSFVNLGKVFILVSRFFDADVAPEHKTEIALQRWQKLQVFKPSPDSYLLNAFPKSGTHWLWEIMTMLLHRKAEVSPMFKEDFFLEMKPTEKLPTSSPYPIIYTTQFPPSQIPKSFASLKRVIILRNPKDVLVSAYHHILSVYDTVSVKFDDLYNLWMNIAKENPQNISENYWNFTREAWRRRNQPNILLLFYEDLIKNFQREVKKISQFMGSDIDEELINEIQAATEITYLKGRKLTSNLHPPEHRIPWSQLYRKGKIGQWKEFFAESQCVDFDRVTDSLLADCDGLHFVYE